MAQKVSDPLKMNSESFHIPMDENAFNTAFDMAAMSFAMNHGLPIPTKSCAGKPNLAPKPVVTEQKIEAEPVRSVPKMPSAPPPKDFENAPRPNPGIIYPPPLPFDGDPDRLRLLHAWYWAGYYTGLADGKNRQSKNSQ